MAEIETQEQRTAAEVATALRELADQFEAGGAVTLEIGGETAHVTPTEPITMKLEAESDWQQGEPEAKQSVEVELVWRREVTEEAEGRVDVPE